MKDVPINVAQVVGGGICVSAADGHRVHDLVYDHILAGHRVCLSFESVTRMTTAFLNTAVGQLYGAFPPDRLREQLAPPVCADPRQLVQLKLVVDRAKVFFDNPVRARADFSQAIESDDG
ncbi:STAS-like domain-containing protein [Methylobacterium sp. J-090]|uniref:STAS-like domain-containing protein n=1 Tax=Methylobacterium sp. J-090 TaxID=2836666 RepID=UPI001FBA0779|nr:STAS-like domain-containing protein [Methylobacterium sp. J-090]MCJ2080666.1 STAS-like domain-containing protein [Methylobacterium sp. J-090]